MINEELVTGVYPKVCKVLAIPKDSVIIKFEEA